MKRFVLSTIFSCIYLVVFSQDPDTCEYVANNNQIGGLDCAMGSLASYQADSYQWLNCDDAFAPFENETNSYYSGAQTSVNVALVVSYQGCVDTSDCNYVCSWGIEENVSTGKTLVKIIGIDGKESEDQPNVPLLYIYSDGTTKKVFRIE